MSLELALKGRTCHLCGRGITAGYQILGGSICNPCYSHFRRNPSPCPSCGITKVLAFLDVLENKVCATCAGLPARFACKTCGSEEQLTGSQCGPCRLQDRARQLLSNPDGNINPDLQGFYEQLLGAPDSRSVVRWLKRPLIADVLQAMAQGDLAVSHQTLDNLEQTPRIHYLRRVLVNAGTLPPINFFLNDYELWARSFIAELPISQANILRRYNRWFVLRSLRRHTVDDATDAWSAGLRKTELRTIAKFIAWCEMNGLSLGEAKQHELEFYLARQSPSVSDVLRTFVRWARRNKIATALRPIEPRPRTPRPAMSEKDRWIWIDRLLVDEAIDLRARITGLFVLAFAQPVARCLRLKRANVSEAGGRISIKFADDPVEMPETIGRLVLEYVRGERRGSIYTPRSSTWLFEGQSPDAPMTHANMTLMLRKAGLQPRQAREAAMRQLSSSLPARVVADTLGGSVQTAARWAQLSGGTWQDYPGLRS